MAAAFATMVSLAKVDCKVFESQNIKYFNDWNGRTYLCAFV